MKAIIVMALLLSSSAFATQLNCEGGGENITIDVQQDQITVSDDYGVLQRETKDPDCAYRSKRYACYESYQLMMNIPLALARGEVKKGTVYIQLDTGDNVDAHNHALLGAGYSCEAQ